MGTDAREAAKRADIARRYKRTKRPPATIAALRVADLTKLYRARYGVELPNDRLGRDCAMLMAHHLSWLSGDPRKRITNWLSLWCRWMPLGVADALLAEAVLEPRRWKADKLSWRLQLIEADRQRLGITTIGAIDASKATRAQRRRERHRLLAQQRRRKQGRLTRVAYLVRIKATKRQPWIAASMSRAAWYRQRARETAK